jgi:hypothetical protein
MARAGEEFPLECPNCGSDVRLIAFITEPGPILVSRSPPAWAHPVIANGKLYIRDQDLLLCYDVAE